MRKMFDWLKGKDIAPDEDSRVLSNQITAPNNDGSIDVENSVNNFILNFDWSANSQADLINKYREVANYNEVDYAIQDIINEMVSFSEDEEPVKINLDNVDISDNIKDKIQEKWDKICKILYLRDTIHQRASNFYIDGRLAYQKVVDSKNLKKGLINIIELDTRNTTKVRNINYNETTKTIEGIEEYFIYKESSDKATKTTVGGAQFKEALQLSKESITYVTSGLIDPKTGYAISWLHKAVKPANQLRMMENSLVIYRITRAPERRVFYVDVGNLPKSKAEQYLNNLKNSFRNRMSYDPESGSFKDQRHLMTMQEDFWLPRTSGGKGTEVSTLPGGANLDSIEDVLYFLKRLYKALNIPTSRLEQDSIMSIGGRGQEISRDELKFSKFVSKIRKRFNMMFRDLLKTELILTNIIKSSEWVEIENNISFIYAQDMYLEERKFFEMMRDRLELAKDMNEYVGKYYSHDFIRTKILQQTDEDIKVIDKEIEAESKLDKYKPDEEEHKF
jgi:hypothetical protein